MGWNSRIEEYELIHAQQWMIPGNTPDRNGDPK
jgi:hypothetical protein